MSAPLTSPARISLRFRQQHGATGTGGATVSDRVNEPLITDKELAEAIFAKVRNGASGFAVVQLVREHVTDTGGISWNGKTDDYRNIPQVTRHQFLERLEALRS